MKIEKHKWIEIEYKECSEDWRNRDRMIWATFPVIVTVSSVILGIAYGYITSNDLLWIRLLILLIGFLFCFVLLVLLVKHRYYQEGSEEMMLNLLKNVEFADEYNKNQHFRRHKPKKFKLEGKLAFMTRFTRSSGYRFFCGLHF